METLGESHVIINSYVALIASLLFTVVVAYLLYTAGEKYIFGTIWTRRQRRRRHLRAVDSIITDLRYKIINLALRCERGDLSLTAFNRRTMNAARLIRRYEIKRNHLNKLVR